MSEAASPCTRTIAGWRVKLRDRIVGAVSIRASVQRSKAFEPGSFLLNGDFVRSFAVGAEGVS